jgi:type I restriction enzyme S subunit
LRSVNVRQDGNIDLADVKKMLIPESELLKYDVRIGDIFVNEGGDVGRNAIWQIQSDQEFAFQNQLHRLRPVCGVESRYVQFVLRHAKSSGVIAAMSSGVTIQHFSASAIRKLAFPLPPVEEQKRIVTKVDELMALCDELEATQDQRNAIRTAARKSAIDAISIATTPEELDVAWKRISENWLTIADTPESIASLRSLILDMFLGNVFENGQSVKTVKLGDVVRTLNGDRSSNYPSKEHRVKSGIPFINAGHLVNGKIVLTDMDYITPQKYESLSGGKIMLNDVLFCLRGSLGKCALNNEILHGTVASSLTILRPNENLDANYLLRFLQSGLCGGQIKKYDNGTAQPNLSAKNLTKFELQVPGVEEQKRIVAKVDQLMALCDQLENSLLGRVELGKKVAAAITAEVAA